MNKIIDGKKISLDIKTEIKNAIDNLELKPKLVVIQIGDDEASNTYIKGKQKASLETGISFEHIKFDSDVLEKDIINKIVLLNKDVNTNGIIVQLPIPKHLDSHKIINYISEEKDVDGLTDVNLGKLMNNNNSLAPCTPTGIMYLLSKSNINLEGKHVVIIGRSNLVGKPLIHMLLNQNATVSICHSKTENLKNITSQADILIVAVGKKYLINSNMIKNDVVIIDVGINKENNKIYGDVNFEDVLSKVSYITPVPGGVGPMTVAMLLNNTLKCYKKMNKK